MMTKPQTPNLRRNWPLERRLHYRGAILFVVWLTACVHTGNQPTDTPPGTSTSLSSEAACTIAAQIQDPGDPWPLPQVGWYLSALQIAEIMKGETPPPTDNADLAEIVHSPHFAQNDASCNRALQTQNYRDLGAFFSVDENGGPLLTPEEIGRVRALMARIRVEQDLVTWPYKDTDPSHYPSVKGFNRNRPFIAYMDPPNNLRVCKGTKGVRDPDKIGKEEQTKIQSQMGSSFPSAHAAESIAQARALGLIFAERKERLLARAQQIGRDRVILRVHYPSDVAASFRIGDKIFEALRGSSRFMQDIEAVRLCPRQPTSSPASG